MKSKTGKLSTQEGICPHCKSDKNASYVDMVVLMELSAWDYKQCWKCKKHFVDTYLIVFPDTDEGDQEKINYVSRLSTPLYESHETRLEIFKHLYDAGCLQYDEDNPNNPEGYYDIPSNAVDFIKED